MEPLTVQTDGVGELKVTGRPELAVALTVVLPRKIVAGLKVIGPMVCDALPIVMFPVTRGAAL